MPPFTVSIDVANSESSYSRGERAFYSCACSLHVALQIQGSLFILSRLSNSQFEESIHNPLVKIRMMTGASFKYWRYCWLQHHGQRGSSERHTRGGSGLGTIHPFFVRFSMSLSLGRTSKQTKHPHSNTCIYNLPARSVHQSRYNLSQKQLCHEEPTLSTDVLRVSCACPTTWLVSSALRNSMPWQHIVQPNKPTWNDQWTPSRSPLPTLDWWLLSWPAPPHPGQREETSRIHAENGNRLLMCGP